MKDAVEIWQAPSAVANPRLNQQLALQACSNNLYTYSFYSVTSLLRTLATPSKGPICQLVAHKAIQVLLSEVRFQGRMLNLTTAKQSYRKKLEMFHVWKNREQGEFCPIRKQMFKKSEKKDK